MKKLLATMIIDNYEPKITELTLPFLKEYAKKIDADFYIIDKRKYPQYPINYEKFQMYDLSVNYDYSIFFDADTLIHPDSCDITNLITKDCVVMNGCDNCNVRFKNNDYFRRDSRYIGACTWCVVCSDWTRDVWLPMDKQDIDIDYIRNNIQLALFEKNFGYNNDHVLDDYLVSRNIAKFGLKVRLIIDDIGKKSLVILAHTFAVDKEYKIKYLKKIIKVWNERNLKDEKFVEDVCLDEVK